MKEKSIIKITFSALLLGRAWLLFKKPSPITAFIYHPYLENTWSKITGLTVENFLASTNFRAGVVLLAQAIACFLMLALFSLFFTKKTPSVVYKWLSYSVFVVLVFLSFSFYLSKNHQLVQFFEYASQMAMPLLFYAMCIKNNTLADLQIHFWIKVAIALTFICHGLYALGVYPQPGHFVDMMIQGFGMSEPLAKTSLKIAGGLDIIVAIGLFIPNQTIYKTSLWYLLIWGLLTTFARLVANVDLALGWYSWQQWLPETLVRFPHFALPLLLLLEREK